MNADYHIHTALCRHATGLMSSYVENGIHRGLSELGFSDHAPDVNGLDPSLRMSMDEYPLYAGEIFSLRERYAEISVLFGIETDIYDGFGTFLEKLEKRYRPEYIIGSVHMVNGISVFSGNDHPGIMNDSDRFIDSYFNLLKRGLRSGLIHVIGHLDAVKWAVPQNRSRIADSACSLLREVRDEGLILELNTSGLRKKPAEMYPSAEVVREAASLKIPVCLGSDAHRPEDVGCHFSEAEVILREAGYHHKGLSGPLSVYTA